MKLSAFSHLRHRAPTIFAIHKKEYHTISRKVSNHLVDLDVDDDEMHPGVLNPELHSGKITLY